jgi:hypothetical protein
MPLSNYYKGHGEKVMRAMKKHYGEDKGEQVFYATKNKRKGLDAGPSKAARKKHGV